MEWSELGSTGSAGGHQTAEELALYPVPHTSYSSSSSSSSSSYSSSMNSSSSSSSSSISGCEVAQW